MFAVQLFQKHIYMKCRAFFSSRIKQLIFGLNKFQAWIQTLCYEASNLSIALHELKSVGKSMISQKRISVTNEVYLKSKRA